MNTFWKITQNIFQNRWVQRYYTIRKRSLFNVRNKKMSLFLRTSNTCFQTCIASSIIPHGKINVEDDLRKAVEEGESAIVNLMNELRDLVITVSKEYRTCLTKQIELIKKTGDEASAELPKFRTLARELSMELNEYIVLLKTIGDIAYDQARVSLIIDKNGLETILKKYKELEILLLQEFEANKRKELELLEVNIANIVPD